MKIFPGPVYLSANCNAVAPLPTNVKWQTRLRLILDAGQSYHI